MSDFNWAIDGSGVPWTTGGSTITINGGLHTLNKVITDREYVFREPSGAQPAYLDLLNSRYLYAPSGWNA